jgi:hypothetical protein
VGFEDAQCPASRDPLPSSISPYLRSTCAVAGSGSGFGIPWHRFQLRAKNYSHNQNQIPGYTASFPSQCTKINTVVLQSVQGNRLWARGLPWGHLVLDRIQVTWIHSKSRKSKDFPGHTLNSRENGVMACRYALLLFPLFPRAFALYREQVWPPPLS